MCNFTLTCGWFIGVHHLSTTNWTSLLLLHIYLGFYLYSCTKMLEIHTNMKIRAWNYHRHLKIKWNVSYSILFSCSCSKAFLVPTWSQPLLALVSKLFFVPTLSRPLLALVPKLFFCSYSEPTFCQLKYVLHQHRAWSDDHDQSTCACKNYEMKCSKWLFSSVVGVDYMKTFLTLWTFL
jgi:hypothetical protein